MTHDLPGCGAGRGGSASPQTRTSAPLVWRLHLPLRRVAVIINKEDHNREYVEERIPTDDMLVLGGRHYPDTIVVKVPTAVRVPVKIGNESQVHVRRPHPSERVIPVRTRTRLVDTESRLARER